MRNLPLRALLRLDAAACAVMGVALASGAEPIGALTDLPAGLLLGAGVALLPIAAFIVWAARPTAPGFTARVVVLGNWGWAAASLTLLASGLVAPNGLGTGLVLAQAVVVAGFAWSEQAALRAVLREA